MTRLKVCCIATPAEAALAVAHGADAVGLVGAMPSGPGPIDDATIAAIAATVPPPVATFLLTSRTDAGGIVDHARRTGVSTVQIVDRVPPAVIDAVRAALPALRIVPVVHVTGEDSLAEALAVAPHADALLLDSGRPDARELGGTGRVHDWQVSRRIVAACGRPVFLAGGLTPANVAGAVAAVRPFAVDVCSGLRPGGQLDPDLLAAFVRAVRAA